MNTTDVKEMRTDEASLRQEIYQLKVTLLDTDPPIRRRLQVPARITLAALHEIVQVAMGWERLYGHEFTVKKQRFGVPPAEPHPASVAPVIDDRTVRLSTVLARRNCRMIYTYDLYDWREHRIVLEREVARDPDLTYPRCTAGERACPPEDCGGIPWFYDILTILADPIQPRYQVLRDWLGDDYDPDAFSPDDVNRTLTALSQLRGHRLVNEADAR